MKLRIPAIQKFYIGLQEKGLSPKSIKNIHVCLHKALDIPEQVQLLQSMQAFIQGMAKNEEAKS